MDRDDYVLTIEQVSKRLNKSVRTIHRYKDSGKLSFRVGETQGNPLFFSEHEVEALRGELYPHFAPTGADGLGERLERVERVLGVLERNPFFERVLAAQQPAIAEDDFDAARGALDALARGEAIDREALGRLLIRLGNQLLDSVPEQR